MFSTKTRNKTIAILALFVAFAVVFVLLGFNKISVNASQAEVSINTENPALDNPVADNVNGVTATIINGNETTSVVGNEQQVEFELPAAKNIDGYTFLGWNVGNEIYQANNLPTAALISAENITATAIYAKLDFLGGGVRKTEPTGVRFKFELEVYNVTDQAVMNNVARTIRGTFNLRTSQDNIAEVKGYKVDGNKIAMNAVVINEFDAKNKTEDKTFCDSDITVTLEINVCGTTLSKTDKRSLTYISSVVFANGEFEKQSDAEKYGCVVALLEYTEVKDETNTTIIGYSVSGLKNSSTATVAVIPKEYNNLPVISIGDYAFYFCKNLTSLTIPNSVTSIGNYAFWNCSKLANIKIPDSVTSIGNYAFSECTGLTSITIPDSVTSIGEYAFNGCTSLTSVTIGNGVTSIGEYAFWFCTHLTSVTIGNSVTSIGNSAFYNCYKLVEIYNLSSLNITKGSDDNGFVGYYALGIYTSLDVPSKLSTTNDGYVFYENGEEVYLIGYQGNKTELTLPSKFNNKNYAINNYAFYDCTGLTSVTIPNSVTSIGNYAFDGCTGLTNVIIGNKVTSIGYEAFYGCSSLTSVTIPNSVTFIDDYAFNSCSSLTSVTIPNSVTFIGESAFKRCYMLVEVYNLSSLNITKGSNDNGYVGYYAKDIYTSLDVPSKLSTINDGYIFYENGEEVYLMGYKGNKTELSLPSNFNNKNYAIYNYAFNKCTSLTSVVIPDSVTSIDKYAFRDCTSLTSVTIGNSVTSIGNSAFDGCENLTSVTIPDSVTSIGNRAFYSCSGLTSVTIGNSVTSIGDGAFSDCTGLTSVIIPNSVTFIDDYAFAYCSGLTSINIPNNVTYIGDYTFYATGLISINIPDSVTYIGDYTFYATGLTSVTIGSGVTSISYAAFSDCTGLTSITISNSVTYIADYTFDGCTKLTNVYYFGTADEWNKLSIGNSNDNLKNATRYYYCETQPTVDGNYWNYNADGSINAFTYTAPKATEGLKYTKINGKEEYAVIGIGTATDTDIVIPSTYQGLLVTSIGNNAFEGCIDLTSVTIPNSVTSIGWNAFNNCKSLTSVYIYDLTAWCKISFGGYAANPLYYAHNLYLNDELVTNLVIPKNITSIDYFAFDGYKSLTNVTMPNSVTSIGEYAFRECTGLKSITIPDSVTSIGSNAFNGCTSLTSITIPNSVTSIAGSAFQGCTSLTSITISNSVTSIGDYTFYGCTGLTSVTIPDSVTSIGYETFYGCTGLKSITIPNSVTSIAGSAFQGCTSLTSVTIPNSITSLVDRAFYGCTSLTSVKIPHGVTSIGNYAFCSCTGLTSISIPDSVTSIGDSVFQDCTGLVSVTIGNSVTSIGERTFSNCTSLTSIIIPNSVTSIGNFAFQNCYKLAEVYNLSSLNISKGSKENGRVAENALDVYTSLDTPSKLSTTNDGYVFYENGEQVYLIDYKGKKTELTLPSNFNNKNYAIFDNVFKDRISLTSVKIPHGVTSIGNYAFSGCIGLTSVTIGNSITSIEDTSFRACHKLVEVYNLSKLDITKGNDLYGYVGYYAKDIYTSLDEPSKLSTTNDGYVFYENGEQVYLIGYKGNKTELTLPSNFNNKNYAINKYAFQNCSELINVKIPDSVTSIGDYAFFRCERLTSVTMGNGVTSICNYVFQNCTMLTNINIPDSVKLIGDSAFKYCNNLYIYYHGTQEMWKNVKVGTNNTPIANNKVYYYSETEPTSGGNYWHYDVDGVTPVVWKKQN